MNSTVKTAAQFQAVEGVEWDDKGLGLSCEIRIKKDEDGGRVAYVATLPGVVGQGENLEEAMRSLRFSLVEALQAYGDEKMPIPWRDAPPRRTDEESLRIIVNV
ncbi:MAG: type II toxin-antitoxin system HicB family antitoxin [Phycisphaerales bacterium]|nr:type II toxin-antitoxin system HicB family antitoxin [Phycisphaerales bacterium]